MFHKDGNRRRTWKGRAFSLFLTAVLLLGSMPGLTLPASAHWADSYLDQMVDWGVMRADQISNPDTPLTRAEFMAIINRAYGYTEVGPMPFEDVSESDWFYDDVAIAYNAGYMKGTSKTTAAPNSRLTREQAICILGRNMMLKEMPGEDMAFADSRSISGWARGMVKAAVNNYIVTGYPDDTFRPKDNITKGQMAVLVSQCLGTPVNGSGAYELGDVSGNVTITAPNVTLRNTTISGDLYVSGGVGLGGVKLENVNVLGRIVVSGTGESEGGAASVIMRNVNAEELLVDNMRKKYVTVRADGVTEIAKTTVRTNAYLEDNNTDDKGLLNITLEGKSGTRLDLAGRIKKVLDKTPDSFIQVAKGTVQSITVDETATNSVIQINRNTEVKELNLDVAANVNGEGDVGKLNINAPGSTVTMLPDDIYIRPGITGNVNGTVMDSAAAEESSLDPRLLSGYPAASDVAPTGFRADFAGNKKGTVYWAVSSIADGSIGAEDLISPPSYGSKAVRGGSVGVPAGDTVGSTQVNGLTVGDSYYLSAVLVDGRNERSPVKVISFTTPDNSKPAFAQGYPYMSLITNTMAQVTVMPTKTCKMYYAVLLKGAPAPTAAEMRSASVTGNLGYGIVDVVKNTERVVNVSNRLQELKEYTLYLWLSDADGVNSSAVVPVQFKTVDKTPPKFNPDPDPRNAVQEDESVKMTAGLNEPGTIYWVAVAKDKIYPPPASDPDSKENVTDANGNLVASLTSQTAKIAVKNHTGASIYGSVKVSKADTEVDIDVKNLKPATAYDFYYVAEDTAGNFSDAVKKITIRTRDNVGPVVTQYFRDITRGESIPVPRASDEVVLKFSEEIKVDGKGLLDLYNSKKFSDLEAALKNFKLYYLDERGTPVQVDSVTSDTDTSTMSTWVNYRNVVVRSVEDGIEVAFSNEQNSVKLVSGREYYFELTKITDMSDNNPKGFERATNPVLRHDTVRNTEHVLPTFTIAPATVKLSKPSISQISPPPKWEENIIDGSIVNSEGTENSGADDIARVDGRFYMDPESTKEMGDTYYYDIVLFSEKAMRYDVYYRVLDPEKEYEAVKSDGSGTTTKKFADYAIRTGDATDSNGWVYLGNVGSRKTESRPRDLSGINRDAEKGTYKASIDNLSPLKNLGQDVRYEFAVSVTELNGKRDYDTWGDSYKVHVSVIAGAQNRVNRVLEAGTATEETVGTNDGIQVVSDPFYITMAFNEFDAPPGFSKGPTFIPHYDGSPTAQIEFGLDNPGTLYYMIRPKENPISTTDITTREDIYKAEGDTTVLIASGTKINRGSTPTAANTEDKTWEDLLWRVVSAQTGLAPEDCGQLDSEGWLKYYSVDAPLAKDISDTGGFIAYDRTDKKTETVTLENVDGWTENGKYYIYIVLEPSDSSKKSDVYIYNFMAGEIDKPKMSLDQVGEDFVVDTEYEGKGVDSKLNWRMFQQSEAEAVFGNKTFTPAQGGAAYPGVSTWLDALTTKFVSDDYPSANYASKDGFTVFDVLASDTDKLEIWTIIREGRASGGTNLKTYGNGSNRETNRNYEWSDNWYETAQKTRPDEKDWIRNMEFLILVGGRHKDSDDAVGYTSFRALEKVSLESLGAPQLNSATKRTLTMGWNGTNIVFDGAINLTFEPNKPVYWKESKFDTTYYRVIRGTGEPTGSGTNATVGLAYDERDDSPYTNATGASPTFTVDFENAASASSYQLLGGWGLCAYNGNDPGTGLALSFGIEEELRADPTKPDDPNATVKYIRGRCEAVYSHRDERNLAKYISYTDWVSEEELKKTTVTTPGPKLDTVNTKVISVKGSDGTARVAIAFDKAIFTKSGSTVTPINDITTDKKYGVSPTGATVKVTQDQNASYGAMYYLNVSNITNSEASIILLPKTEIYASENSSCIDTNQSNQTIRVVVWTTTENGTTLAHAKIYFGNNVVHEMDEATPPKLTNAVINDLDGGNGTAKIVLNFSKPLYDASGKVISDIACKTASGKAVAKATKTGPSQYTLNVSGIDKTGSTITVLKGIEVYDATGKAHAQKGITIEVKLDDGGSGVLTGPTALNRAWAKVTADDLKAPIEKTETQASSRRR